MSEIRCGVMKIYRREEMCRIVSVRVLFSSEGHKAGTGLPLERRE